VALTTEAAGRFASPESYTPKHLVEKILASKGALVGEHKLVTVLFCDLVGSTTLAERLGPEAMHVLLSRFFELALAEVHRYEGTVNQFLGDGFMALFGAPIAHEDHARRAILAALSLQRAIGERAPTLVDAALGQLRVRMGLNTGPVVVGAIGDDLRMDYTAVGDTTNLAARFQQLAEPGTIVTSDATVRLVRRDVEVEPLGPLAVRGKSTPVRAYRVTGSRLWSSPGNVAERTLTPFVGRQRDLTTLQELVDLVETGQGQVVAIVGEPECRSFSSRPLVPGIGRRGWIAPTRPRSRFDPLPPAIARHWPAPWRPVDSQSRLRR
jgi:class 3 adenylate cyclase